MGKKNRQGRRRRGKDNPEEDDALYEDSNSDQLRNAKESAKLSKKRKKKLKRQETLLKVRGLHRRKPCKKYGWHSVQVHDGAALEREFLFTSIGNVVDEEFQPLGFHKIDNMCCFYLEKNEAAASSIEGLSKRLPGPNGNLLKITVTPILVPDLILNSNQLKIMLEVMSKRFSGDSCLLDLTDLHHDPVFIENNILAPLSSPGIMKQVLRLIKENIPHIKALNLSKNSLRVSDLKALNNIYSTSSQLGALNLEQNDIGDVQIFKLIKMFPLTELNLQDNPFLNSYKEAPLKYAKLVRKELPSLKIIDTIDIEKYISENTEPKTINASDLVNGYSSSSSINISEPMVRTFLEQYYTLVDGTDRSGLVAAYSPNAVLEVKSSIDSIGSCVFEGQDKIRDALGSMPATQHDHSSFSLNIQFLGPVTAQAVVTGRCQLAGMPSHVTFIRSMNIVPFNAGLCCSKDVLELR